MIDLLELKVRATLATEWATQQREFQQMSLCHIQHIDRIFEFFSLFLQDRGEKVLNSNWQISPDDKDCDTIERLETTTRWTFS